MKKKMYLSVVIPCYNEKKNLDRGVLDEVENYLKKQEYTSEVIVSDDGSTDGSLEFVKKFVRGHPRFKQLLNQHGGKPLAVWAGVKKARGEIVLFSDMDQSTPLGQVAKLLPYFEKNYEVVIGSRGQSRKGFSVLRQSGAIVFRLIRQLLLVKKIIDTQCGFKAFKTKVAMNLFSRLTIFEELKKAKGWTVGAFDVELLFIAQKMGYQIAEVPVKWQDEDQSVTKGDPGKKYLKESKEMFLEIFRVKLNDLKGRYRSVNG
ncbi:glycosyltransferase [Patescibacteria group bacterium]